MTSERPIYCFDGTLTGLLCCVFRAFQFREYQVEIHAFDTHQNTTARHSLQDNLFNVSIEVASQDVHAQRVWNALKNKLSNNALRQLYYAFLAENTDAYQHIFNYCIYIFRHAQTQQIHSLEKNYTHPSVLAIAQWAKKVGREKHRMEAFVRFKKSSDGLFLSLIAPDFNVLPLIQRHFRNRYQDQRWLIYDEKRHFGIYYDLDQVQEVDLSAQTIDAQKEVGGSQQFLIDLDDQEVLYDQLWKDYFQSINIKERQNIKLHVQCVPKRYWRYLNEKSV
ncbi:TIGR03915 family putative DNA repair protein [Acinetobacter sp. A3.8]|uniref:TIGR03915 family putative DNA repair protein n=1 Tax=Acinetobacter sedimenti TaxID=2919922 RepID=A0A9X2B5X5_9GAMM|nr:TIGR03915 family putative DNA repair protein [Acinetobacter sedimenti]MCJ8146078.1 TIGR03915 family putative DNA repair protein [Acinetobacter sedimenti]